jgi:hypothetical protein
MSLQDTNLAIESAPLPAHFQGYPHELQAAIVARLKIKSPSGLVFVVSGDAEPVSNQGPWLKEGDKWYVWDESTKRYIPQNISDSETFWFHVSETAPTSTTPAVWLKVKNGRPVDWYFWNGNVWVPSMQIVQAGTTANRPTDPVALQRYYDTDIGCEIWWERSAWRTVSGSPGDIKHVLSETAAEALLLSPGWEILGTADALKTWRGRTISMATRDPGATPAKVFAVDAAISQRQAHEVFGETQGMKTLVGSAVTYPPTISFWALVKL